MNPVVKINPFRHRVPLWFLCLAVMMFDSSAPASVTLPHVFGDNMVLQREKPVPIWGWAEPGEQVVVQFGNQTRKTRTDKSGHWHVRLKPLEASSQPASLTVSGSNVIALTNVLVGEVWLCSGQSNMEKPIGEQRGQKPVFNAAQEISEARYPEIRLLHLPRSRIAFPTNDIDAQWVECSPETIDSLKFSAAGYFFGRDLYRELHVPIGLIDSSWGGTRIEPWTPPVGFTLAPDLEHLAEAARYPGTKAEGTTPSELYNGMIHPLVPFALRGAIWYQGESNLMDVNDGLRYENKMEALIRGWRSVWKDNSLRFYYVQIAPYRYYADRPTRVRSGDELPLIWEAQTEVLRLPYTGMIVTTDLVDDLSDIHPRDKQSVGKRLALIALAKDYGRKDFEYSGPMFKRMRIREGMAVLSFEHVDGGLTSSDGQSLSWFTIAGADGKFVTAEAHIEDDQVVVFSPDVADPRAVRFAWSEVAQPNFFNKALLPAVPFRTDNL